MADVLGYALGPVIVTVIRLLVPFTILKWPFWGGLLSAILDAIDVILTFFFQLGDYKHYHQTDKVLDTYFLVFMVIVARKWKLLERKIAFSLFGWRMIGFVLFEATGVRPLLLIFPNLFLWWWLFVAGRDKFAPKWEVTPKRALMVLAIMLLPKLTQEFILHFLQLQPTVIGREFIRSLFAS